MNEIIESTPSSDERNLAMLAHLLGIFVGFLGPLVIWLIKKDESPFVAQESREALNFQITMSIGFICSGILMFVLVGFLLMPLLILVNFIFCIIGAVAASKGQAYRYPVAIRLVS